MTCSIRFRYAPCKFKCEFVYESNLFDVREVHERTSDPTLLRATPLDQRVVTRPEVKASLHINILDRSGVKLGARPAAPQQFLLHKMCCGAVGQAPNFTPDRSSVFIWSHAFTPSLVTVLTWSRLSRTPPSSFSYLQRLLDVK